MFVPPPPPSLTCALIFWQFCRRLCLLHNIAKVCQCIHPLYIMHDLHRTIPMCLLETNSKEGEGGGERG